MLQLQGMGKDFAGRTLFAGVDWHLRPGERVGLVGENGAGKSTLLRILAGEEEPGAGMVQLARGARVGYLAQDAIVSGERSLFAEVLSGREELLALERELHQLTARLAELPAAAAEHEPLLARLGTVQEAYRQLGGYALEAEVGTVLHGLGFARDDNERPCRDFSGGWQMRIALARLLLQRPDLLLLDEPTNHLDIEARNWLEEYLAAYAGSVILVSHDRFFLDRVCSRITEVWNGTLTDYPGDYSHYLVAREERVAALRIAKQRQDEEIARLEEFIARFRAQASKASLVQSRVKQLEKIERISLPPHRKQISFRFPSPPPSGRIVVELAGVTRAYGEKVVLRQVGMTVSRGERIALVGHNGAGKSTLMGVLAGGPLQEGSRNLGHNVVLEYFAQDQALVLDGTRTVYGELLVDAPFDTVPQLRDLLGAFLFSGDDVQKPVSVLSGGERNRLALAKLLLRPANLLLLDEPTNHLDLASKEVLLRALQDFTGTLVFVSHDRYFVDALATRVVEVADGRLASYPGNYEDYLAATGQGGLAGAILRTREQSVQEPLREAGREQRQQQREAEKQRQREERARQKRVAELEVAIHSLEAELAELTATMGAPGFFADGERARRAGERHAALEAELAERYAAWEVACQEESLATGSGGR